jgi:3-oxoacyl-[acyl-carrier protein] reductase
MSLTTQISLRNKRALVCGASQGIGAATAKAFAELGAQVILLARRQEALEQILKDLPGQGHVALAIDLGSQQDLKAEIQKLLPIHIIVNNSGGPASGSLIEATEENFSTAFQQHILAAHTIAQIVVPEMKKQNYGRFINIISTSVKTPLANLGVSNTIRGAMASWAKTMANELGPFGITVNNILPGLTKTPRFESLKKSTAEKTKASPESVEDQWKSTIPLRRFAEASEVAMAIAFLASPAAGYISGINLPVDGGRTPSL